MRGDELRKMAAEIRERVNSAAEERTKKASLVLDAAVALGILRKKVSSNAR